MFFLRSTKGYGIKLKPDLWIKNYADSLFRYAFVRINDYELSKDMVQDTFLAALRNSEGFKGEISEKNWLFLILKNKIIDHYKKKASKIVTSLNELEKDIEDFFDDSGHWKKEHGPQLWNSDTESATNTKDFQMTLDKCLSRLQELSRICFVMKYLDEKESDEICKELQITSSNYWVLIHRSKLKIRNCLEKNGMKNN